MGATVMDQLDRLRAALAGRYALDREIGRGGMAHVYRAHDLQHDRDVAIKVLRPDLAAAVGTDRFLREIRIEARLQHPHILPVYDSGEAGGLVYYVMPYVPGETLRELIRRDKQLPIPAAVQITREIADALSYAHAHDVVHRDVKPANILLSGEHAVVADFGIAKAISVADPEALTGSGIAVGTPEYMSPEQGAGDGTADRRSDIYALGCVLYEMLAGEPPFTGRSAQNILARHRQDPPPSLRVVRPAVPPAVERVVETALAKVPADRYATVNDFAKALAEAAEPGPAAPSTPISSPALVPAAHRRIGRWIAAAGSLMLVAGVIVFFAERLRPNTGAHLPVTSWIVVADFDGPPNDRTLATAVRELVTAELDQSRVVIPMPRQQLSAVMREAGLADSTPLTPALARELAVRSSVRSILSGSVLPVGDNRYSIVLRVTDADSGRTLLTETGAASSQDFISAVEHVARAIRRGLGEHDDALRANKPLARVATTSFPAYRKYVAGLEFSEQGDLAAGNRLMHEALELDTGFASAWSVIAINHLTMRNLDSAALALGEALRRPDRLSDAQRYRLEAESAYALRYDIEGAVRWYDLYLEVMPRSISGHNDRGIYLYSLGRYDEALAEFTLATTLQPFGPSQAQISLFNRTVTLIALGRQSDAEATARELTGPFGSYAAQLLATAKGDWRAAEALAESSVNSPSTPEWIRLSATTMLAGALAAQGRPDAAGQRLRQAIADTREAPRRSFGQALLLLSLATERSPGPAPAWLIADTTAGGLLAAGLWAGVTGDTVVARSRLTQLGARKALELRRLSYGPRLLDAIIATSRGSWRDVIRILGPQAPRELDGGDPDQVSTLALRWVLADAYAHAGRADSAAALLETVLDRARMPFNHLVLRGLVYSSASKRLASLRGQPRQGAGSSH